MGLSIINESSFVAEPSNNYFKGIINHPLMTKEEEYICALSAKKGCEKSFNTMIELNLRLVVKVARGYKSKGAMSFMDIDSEGNMGLIRAAQKFDPEMGYRFSTYAVFWIRDMIERALMNHNRTIRIPIPVLKDLNTYNRAFIELKKQLGRNPSIEEIAIFMGRSIEEIQALKNNTLDTQYIDDTHSNIKTSLWDSDSHEPEQVHIKNQFIEKIIPKLVGDLNENQKKVIAMRYGLNNHREHTLEECVYELKVSRERIRQIQVDSIAKIKRAIPNLTAECEDLISIV